MNFKKDQADICIILEGTYPYVPGGVSNWTHDLINSLKEFKFHLFTIVAPNSELNLRYTLPENVVGISTLVLQQLPPGQPQIQQLKKQLGSLETSLANIQSHGNLADLSSVIEILGPHRKNLGRELLLNSPEAWNLLLHLYNEQYSTNSFLDFFWSWRILIEGFYSVILADLPQAGVYHSTSTGYAGLLLARAQVETKRPALITEHGIYTNERRIEISMSKWLYEHPFARLSIDKNNKDLKDLWMNTFHIYSQICYEACDKIITLYTENQELQKADGAMPEKLMVIPNGVDCNAYSKIKIEKQDRPTIALIGRVVPIKDVKTFIRTCSILKEQFSDLQAYVMGPTEEDPSYFKECEDITNHFNLQETVSFTGKVKLHDYLGRIDVNVLTSISEAQPLVVLEVGAIGIPTVATNVGSCSELILGSEVESPPLGPAGAITPLSDPSAIAIAVAKLLTDKKWYSQCSKAAKKRVLKYYNKADLTLRYKNLYLEHLNS